MNAHLHPVFRAALAPFAPAANDTPALQHYTAQIKSGARVALSFPVMARSRVAAQKAHEGLCLPGEQCVAYTPEEMEAARRRENEAISAHHFEEYEAGLDDVETMDDGEGQ